MEKITVKTKELASFLSINIKTVQRLTPEVFGKINNGKWPKYDLQEAVNNYYQYQLELEKKRYNKNDLKINEIRRRRELAETELKEIELEEKKGELVNKDKYEKDIFKTVRVFRDSVLKIPNRIGDIIAAESDPVMCKTIFRDELKQALEELGNSL